MQPTTPQIQSLPLASLHPHPKNANTMSLATMKKLARHIESTNRYEPLIVRPHPTLANAYQLINGHHRKQILQALHHTHANCLIWNLTDSETLLLLATINRLGGEDAPGKRLSLLDALAQSLQASSADLAKFLPEDQSTLDQILNRAPKQPIAIPPALAGLPEAFTVFLTAAEKKQLTAALEKTHPNPATALMQWKEEIAKSQTAPSN